MRAVLSDTFIIEVEQFNYDSEDKRFHIVVVRSPIGNADIEMVSQEVQNVAPYAIIFENLMKYGYVDLRKSGLTFIDTRA